MTNQHTSAPSAGLMLDYIGRGSQAQEALQLATWVTECPGVCAVPNGSGFVYMRVAGELKKISMRSLVYYLVKGKEPGYSPPSFRQAKCKHPGCVNPAHQHPMFPKAKETTE